MIPFSLQSDVVFTWLVNTIGILLIFILLLALIAVRLRLRNEAKKRRWEEREESWTPILMEVLTEGRSQTDLQDAVPEGDRLAFLNFLHRYAAKVRGEEWSILRALSLPHLEALVTRVRKGSAEQRARSMQILSEFGLPDYADTILKGLDDQSPLVAIIAARRLLRPGSEEHFDYVLQRLDRFAVWSPRFLAGMLANGGGGITDALREIMIDRERTPRERSVAIDALAILYDIDSAWAAGRLLEETEPREVQISLLRLLQQVGHAEHADHVRPLLSTEDAVVRQAAAEALGALGDRKKDVRRLAQLLADPSPWVRMGAAGSLAELGARDRLLEAASGEGPGARAAAEVLAR